MPIAPPAAAIALAPGVAGNPGEETAGMVALTAAELADQVTAAMLTYPTTEPVAPNLPWWDSGVLTKSVGIPPAITSQPSSTSKDVGSTATFSVTATNATSYQWYLQAGGTGSYVLISGATSSSYTTGTLSESDNANNYRCVVTGLGGSTTSNSATLTITPLLQYQVRGFTDSNFFSGPDNVGLSKLGSIRVIFKLLTAPTSSQKVIVGRVDNTGSHGGWYLATAPTSNANTIGVVHRTVAGSKTSPLFTFVDGDIGKHFVLHATCDATSLKLYIGGMEVGTGTATGGAPLDARTTDQMRVGRYQHATGLSNDHIAVVQICTSSAVMTASQIVADAATIQATTTNLSVPDLPSQVDRLDADDLVSTTDWVSRTGSLVLTRNGSVTVEAF